MVPTQAEIMDHLIEASCPAHLRPVLVVGALMGAPFPFELAHEVSMETDPNLGDPDTCWEQLAGRTAQGSILQTQVTADGQRWVGMHRDLASHLGRHLSPAERRMVHRRVAQRASSQAGAVGTDRRDHRYGLLAVASEQWTAAREVKNAAAAHRAAAELAEELLAFDLATSHYRRAIAAFDQGAREEEVCTDQRLGLAHCTYRLGRLHLLAGGTNDQYFATALAVLQDAQAQLRTLLGDADRVVSRTSAANHEVGELRLGLRRCSGLAAYVELSMADQARRGDQWRRRDAANLYCEALQHAEAARGEGDSRWVVAAASARLADLLLEEAAELIADPFPDPHLDERLAMTTRNAIFHAERAIRVRGLDALEERCLAEPRAWSYEVLGRAHQWIAALPGTAYGFFERMNSASLLVNDATDRTTDLGHGLFLLSLVAPGELDHLAAHLRTESLRSDLGVVALCRRDDAAESDGGEVARLLYQCLRWTEATRAPEHRAWAHACLALAWFAAARGDPAGHPEEWSQVRAHVSNAEELSGGHGVNCQRILLLNGLVADLSGETDKAASTYSRALSSARFAVQLDDGRRAAIARLLLELPAVALEGVRRWFGDGPAADPSLHASVDRARRYCERAAVLSKEEPFDVQVWHLAEARLPPHLLCHSRAVRATCAAIAREYWAGIEETARAELVRDLAVAAGLHDWLTDIDPARLLVLAREWDLPMSGVEWANPILLHGRLAVEVARSLYDSEVRLGTERFRRIEQMVQNHTVGSSDATTLEKIFAVADWRAQRGLAVTDDLPTCETDLDAAYRAAFEQKACEVRRRGGLLAPETIKLLG